MGYGFITYETVEDAKKAAETMDKAELADRKINIEVAKPKQERSADDRKAGGRGPRGRRGRGGRRGGTPRREPPTGEPSDKMLFVANLPFELNDDGLCDLFSAFTVSHAHVVTRRNGSSKGFGFVELTSQEEQQKALEALDKSDCQGREISVKVALNDQVPPERRVKTDAAADEAPAPATDA